VITAIMRERYSLYDLAVLTMCSHLFFKGEYRASFALIIGLTVAGVIIKKGAAT